MKNKKGLSEIIATLIIILLVIVAAGIIWVVVRGTVQSSADQVELGSKCLAIDLQFVSYDNASKILTLRRGAGGEEIAGVKVSVYSSTASSGVTNFLALQQLENKNQAIATAPQYGEITVEWTPYFTGKGKELVCQTTRTTRFTNRSI